WICQLFHKGGTGFPLKSCWSIGRTHSSSHICLPLFHVGSRKKSLQNTASISISIGSSVGWGLLLAWPFPLEVFGAW
ncbi:hypothetical protein CFP56_035518, partial [Quercus suber]